MFTVPDDELWRVGFVDGILQSRSMPFSLIGNEIYLLFIYEIFTEMENDLLD